MFGSVCTSGPCPPAPRTPPSLFPSLGRGQGGVHRGTPLPSTSFTPQFTRGPPALTPPFREWQQGSSTCTPRPLGTQGPGDASRGEMVPGEARESHWFHDEPEGKLAAFPLKQASPVTLS